MLVIHTQCGFRKMFKIRIRVFVGVMIFFGYFILYIVRYGLSVHIVEMVWKFKREEILLLYNGVDGVIDGIASVDQKGARRMIDVLNWDNMKMGILFSAYHIGYCVCFPICHNYGDRLGPTLVVGISGMTSGVLTCITPSAAYRQFWFVFVIRIVQGFCAGAIIPNMVQVLRHWVPPIERHHFMWAYCGVTTGTLSTFLLCAAVQYYSRWYVGFYISGMLQVIWSMLWVCTVTDLPRNHPLISSEEVTYLVNTIGNIFTIKSTNTDAPWAMILRSVPFWALCILNFGYSWILSSFAIHAPFFYTKVINYSLHMASILSALPFFFRLVLGTTLIHAFQYYKNTPQVSRIRHVRKYFIIVSHVIPGTILCATWFTPIIPGPILLTLALALTAAGMDLTLEICYEMTPTYVNSINTVIKIIGNTGGIIESLGVGQVTQQHEVSEFAVNTAHIWKHIWCFHASILLLSGVIFLIWGETDVQSWNYERKLKPRRYFTRTLPSIMSNITEVDENDRPSIIVTGS